MMLLNSPSGSTRRTSVIARSTPIGPRLFPLGVHMDYRFVVAALLNLAVFNVASAQPQVIWIQGHSWQVPNYDISFSRRHGPSTFEMGGGYRTLSDAQREVQSLLSWDASMRPSTTTWRLAVIRIEVKPGQAMPSNGGGGSLPRPGRPLSDYVRAVSDAYSRAANARDTLRRQVNSATDSGFRAANQLIQTYNSQRSEAIAVHGQANFRSFPSLPSVVWYYEWRYQGRFTWTRGPFYTTDSLQQDWNSIQRTHRSHAQFLRYYAR